MILSKDPSLLVTNVSFLETNISNFLYHSEWDFVKCNHVLLKSIPETISPPEMENCNFYLPIFKNNI